MAGDKAVSRPVALWFTEAAKARVYRLVAVMSFVGLIVSLSVTYASLHRPREVVRVGCDGIPALVHIDDRVYSEPDEREIRQFVADFVVHFARADSFSAVNDALDCGRKMVPKLRESWARAARGEGGSPGVVAQVEALKRRTQIDPSSLEIEVKKDMYPWQVRVRGVRQIVGQGPEANQPFDVSMELVRASRDEVLAGLLVWAVSTRGERVAKVDTPR